MKSETIILPSLDNAQVLTDEMMEQIENGKRNPCSSGCQDGCKKNCKSDGRGENGFWPKFKRQMKISL